MSYPYYGHCWLLVVQSHEPRTAEFWILLKENSLRKINYILQIQIREANDIENKENRSTTRILFRQNFEPRAGRKKQYVPTAANHRHQHQDMYIRIVRIEQKVHQMQYLPPPPPTNAAAAAVRRHAIRI